MTSKLVLCKSVKRCMRPIIIGKCLKKKKTQTCNCCWLLMAAVGPKTMLSLGESITSKSCFYSVKEPFPKFVFE